MDHEHTVHDHTDHDRTDHGHTDHTDHGHADHEHAAHGHAGAGASWATAVQATLHCLTGCAVGEVLGMVVGTAFGWGNLPTTLLAIVLAFLFGYSLTMRGVLRAGVDLRTAVRVALAADTVSIAVMELIDNGTILVWPAAMDAQLGDALFWISLAVSLVLAFVVTTPVNKWTIGRGMGHAVVHQYHH
ncbi:DUF4396 domain-containing protein [Streptomyces humi]|uniref:DUF4396 domain-containing protein n=1 Tax=Streptomyces humi TaxID=1428620 RepID=UPI000628711B|nr:DUF4396 domain-containing protein [Streptomyces humi]